MAKELAGTHGVTDSNMMTFLGIIEDKVNQILQFYALVTEQVFFFKIYKLILCLIEKQWNLPEFNEQCFDYAKYHSEK